MTADPFEKPPENPFASPSFENKPPVGQVATINEFQIASQGKRFLNLIIDSFAVQFLSTGVQFAIGFVYGIYLVSQNRGLTQESEAFLNFVGIFIALLVWLSYFVFTEVLFLKTLAKLITGTMVVTVDGERPSFGQVLGRSLARLIPFEAFSFLGGNRPVGWHDSLSGTRVIERR